MKTFDYEMAWLEVALPAFKQLPNTVIALLEEVTQIAQALPQGKNLDVIWPDDNGKLRERFERLDNETLSRAAYVIYHYGHWRPGASVAGDAPKSGASWKFANYADQILRDRLCIAKDSKARVSIRLHQGTLRLCYSSPDSWLWHEFAPATEAGKAQTEAIALKLGQLKPDQVWKFFEALKTTEAWPDFDSDGYMVEESVLELRKAARMPKPDKESLLATLQADFEAKTTLAKMELDGMTWLVTNDLPINNTIFYKHLRQFCFGWRYPYKEARFELMESLKAFPFPYYVK